jgi:alpha-beta hydrolase superfamily lysophospholipase
VRRLAAFALALGMVACAAGLPPEPGTERPATRWAPPGEPHAVVLALHGFNDHRTAFAEFAAWAADRGVLVEAYDQRGFGESPDRGLWPGTAALVADLRDRVERMRAARPGVPLYVLGESMGGAVAILALSGPGAPRVDGIVLSAPAVWGGDALNPLYRVALTLARRVAPGLKLSGRGLGRRASDNIPMLQALAADPLFIKETRVDAVAGLVDLMGEARARAPFLPGPLLVLMGARDEIVPPEAQRDWAARLCAPRCTLVAYPEGWHLLLRDLQRERVWSDILAWIDGQPLPSGLGHACRDEDGVAAVSPSRLSPARAPSPRSGA